MATITIHDVPAEDCRALRDAARAHGKSLQAYMLEEVFARSANSRGGRVRRSQYGYSSAGSSRSEIELMQ